MRIAVFGILPFSDLIKEGFKIGKTPSCFYTMIKKKTKRDEFLNQKVTCEVKGVSIMVEWG